MDAERNNLGTPDGFPLGVGWDFRIGATNGTASRAVVTTDTNGFAPFTMTAFAKLEIIEVNGSDLLDVSCWDIAGENDFIHGGTRWTERRWRSTRSPAARPDADSRTWAPRTQVAEEPPRVTRPAFAAECLDATMDDAQAFRAPGAAWNGGGGRTTPR